jgi:hypothetical protein
MELVLDFASGSISLFTFIFLWCHDTQHNDIQHNATQHNSE